MNKTLNILLVMLLVLMSVLSWQLIERLKAHQQMAQDKAEIRHVKYGMLNADSWVRQVSEILEKKIQELEIDDEQRASLKAALERILDTFITEADRYVRRQHTTGDWWDRTTGRIKEGMRDTLMDIETVKAGIPRYADEILKELEKPETRRELSKFLAEIVSDISQRTFATIDASRLQEIPQRYDCGDQNPCLDVIQGRLDANGQEARQIAVLLLAGALLVFLAVWLSRVEADRFRLVLLSWASLLLLLCGVLTPMIEVEAQINDLRFMLMGEPVAFTDEVFYFQSKSVLDVVTVLTATREPDMVVVGILIMTFSVIFPGLKLLASLLAIYNPATLKQSRLVEFFALKSGKWSMADVMVVAIFMAYIGFSGLIGSQLDLITRGAATAGVDVLTTNGTSLQIGFFMFLAFCLASLFASAMMESVLRKSGDG